MVTLGEVAALAPSWNTPEKVAIQRNILTLMSVDRMTIPHYQTGRENQCRFIDSSENDGMWLGDPFLYADSSVSRDKPGTSMISKSQAETEVSVHLEGQVPG